MSALPNVRVVVALGKIAFDAWLQLLKRRGVAMTPRPQFSHGVIVTPPTTNYPTIQLPTLMGCYHPSRQNTNTGKLTPRDDGGRVQKSEEAAVKRLSLVVAAGVLACLAAPTVIAQSEKVSIRMAPRPGQTVHLTMTQEMDFDISFDGAALPGVTGPMKMLMPRQWR